MFNPPRPTVTDEIVREAAAEIAEKLGGSVDDIVKEYSYPMDGYELAKELEKWHYWNIGRDDIDTLDEVDFRVSDLLKKAQQEWAEAHNIQPPFPVGTRVMCRSRRNTGVIDSICDHSPAAYLIKADGHDDEKDGYSRWVCKFEAVEPAEETAA
ncbi:hypothetical protein GCM10011348_46340 [Marinobacterium nitratireducens]|uniref:Uncharacterized protein n=1 Tax=Marinobacterium nitratireducens TaxID=518897 RepID=A0A918DXG1_9GAMM|nr:hypothetical protein [Marinobacterium nitratireducens]GGO89184.1 hypothetical protein GCM10011348_46340 [Marinobacterium nitratireducens]